MMLFYFLGVLLQTIFGSNLPPNPIKSSGQELVIKFKSHFRDGPFYLKNTDAKFLLTYDIEYNSKFSNLIHIVIINDKMHLNSIKRDGVAERTKALVATRTDAGLIPATGGIFPLSPTQL